MPSQLEQLMLNRPKPITGEVQYPTKEVPSMGDDILRGLAVGLGLEEQRPGDPAGALGAAASMLSIMKLLKMFPKRVVKPGMPPTNIGDKLLREHMVKPGMTDPEFNQFHQMPNENPLSDLPREELDKAIDLAKPRPHLEKPKNNKPSPASHESGTAEDYFQTARRDAERAATITKFPPAEARERSRLMTELAKTDAPRTVSAAMADAHKRYPRVQGQVESITWEPNLVDGGVQSQGSLPGTSRIAIGPTKNPGTDINTYYHELAHAAQQKGKGDAFTSLYGQADAQHGYYQNPFEISAFAIGNKAERRKSLEDAIAKLVNPKE